MVSTHFNLLTDRWLPVRRRSGARESIAPHEITAGFSDDPVLAVDAPRADFTAALTEFLIGLLATAGLAEDEDDWDALWDSPPLSERLAEAFAPLAHAFALDGEGPRAFQDLDPLEEAGESPVSGLLIEAPGANTLRLNRDLFVKRGQVAALGLPAAAMALITMQLYAPSGGAGHRTGLRGGGPLTTLALAGESLWHRLWVNVETRAQLAARQPDPRRTGEADIFPWLAPTRTSEKKTGCTTTPDDVHALQAYWPMPRRIRLVFENAEEPLRCAITDEPVARCVRAYRTRPYGVNYEGWQHPLSPHYRQKPGDPVWLPMHGQTGGLTYRHYLGLVYNDDPDPAQARHKPAAAVAHARGARFGWGGERIRLHAFGFDMDNMKALGWVDSEMPVPPRLGRDADDEAEGLVRRMVDAAAIAGSAAQWGVKSALFENPGDVRGDFSHIERRFWHVSEAPFFALVTEMPAALAAEGDPQLFEQRWQAILYRTGLAVFDEHVDSNSLEGGDIARMVRARFSLVMTLRGYSPRGRKLFNALGLPRPKSRAEREEAHV